MITLHQILSSQSPMLEGKRVKIVRHKPGSSDMDAGILQSRARMLEYQQVQASTVFSDCDYIVSFFAEKRGYCKFFGVFQVMGAPKKAGGRYLYALKEVQAFKALVDRLIIDWGGATRAWVQRYAEKAQNKEVISLFPRGYIGPFPGLFDFTLTFNQLESLCAQPDANLEWKHHLMSVKGVYLILDIQTGKQYVGAAYGQDGIWGRWQSYAATGGHGGNKELVALIKKNLEYRHSFHFSVLQALPSNTRESDVTKIEQLYKQKLGSRMYGLNGN